ncbi:hypothetical protein [Crateriforma conspicua]|uniref:hypothetical protein n=1 Tax=Crateriforma conspicua TaxID=2527996 RepID=UPI0036F1F6AE
MTPRVDQAAMRHSDIASTMNTYTDARYGRSSGSVVDCPGSRTANGCTKLGQRGSNGVTF